MSSVKYGKKYVILLTASEKYSRAIPTGMKAIPIMKKVGKTVPAVRTGCQAGSFCCLNAESETEWVTVKTYK